MDRLLLLCALASAASAAAPPAIPKPLFRLTKRPGDTIHHWAALSRDGRLLAVEAEWETFKGKIRLGDHRDDGEFFQPLDRRQATAASRRRQHAAPPREREPAPANEQSVYSGQRLLGTITVSIDSAGYLGRDSDGVGLGVFASRSEAAGAILERSRGAE